MKCIVVVLQRKDVISVAENTGSGIQDPTLKMSQ